MIIRFMYDTIIFVRVLNHIISYNRNQNDDFNDVRSI